MSTKSRSLQTLRFLDDQGREIPDPRPVEIPLGFDRPETLADQVRRLIRSEELRKLAESQEMETFEDSEDFDIDDEMFDPQSPYEEVFDPVLGRGITLDEFRRNEAVYRQRYLEAENRAHTVMVESEALRAIPRAEPSGQAPEGPDAPQAEQPKDK